MRTQRGILLRGRLAAMQVRQVRLWTYHAHRDLKGMHGVCTNLVFFLFLFLSFSLPIVLQLFRSCKCSQP
jgi:hypothetical protein